MVVDTETAQSLKEQGNAAFKAEKWDEAITLYTSAINLSESDSRDLAVFYKNRAAAYLKQERYQEALDDCNESLKIVPTDPKALYRRCQAFESLQRFEEAYSDATDIFKNDPGNKFVQPVLERLHRVVQERVRQNAQTSTKLDTMAKIAFDVGIDSEKREAAMNNLLILSRENAASDLMLKSGIVQKIRSMLKVEKNRTVYISGVRIIGELCKHCPDKTTLVIKEVGIPWFLEILDSECDEQVNAAQYCMQAILNAFSGMTFKNDVKPNPELVKKYKAEIDTLLTCLVCSINSRLISGKARDALIELLSRNVHYDALDWALRLVEIGGVTRLLECTSELEEYKYESAINITPSTTTVAALCLARVYENMYYDQAKETFMEKINEFIREKLLAPDIESKVRVTVSITSLLRGPLDVGNAIIAKEGIMEMVIVMANSDDVLQQKVACECIIAASSKADKAKAIITQGIDILKKLYTSKNDEIKVRALVGMCKLGSSGGTDSSLKPLADGSMLKLAEACRRFLLKPGKDRSMRKWAAEGLSYLTLDAEVKEKLIEDKAALMALRELAMTGDQSCLFGVVTTLVNLCNAYEKQEILPEMLELAKFAKQHIPEEHEFDDPDFVAKRTNILGKSGVTTALVALTKTESPNCRELISRVFNALCNQQELRGVVVQQGGVKALMNLSAKGTDNGKKQAAQALARIAITIDPAVAFPGQRALEIVRPLVSLLHPDCCALENFEALMALCNVAQIDETARQRILKEGGFSRIEHYMYEDHEQLCRAAVQTITNLTMSPDVVKIFEGENDRVKFLVSLCLDEDLDTSLAASGALAILTGGSPKCCEKIFESKNWLDALHALLANPIRSLQHRGVCVVSNIIESSKELSEKLMESDVMEILMALSKLTIEGSQHIVVVAERALRQAEEWGVIQKNEESSHNL